MRITRYDVIRLTSQRFKAYVWGESNWKPLSWSRGAGLQRVALPGQPHRGFDDAGEAFSAIDALSSDEFSKLKFERYVSAVAGGRWRPDLEPIVDKLGRRLNKTNQEKKGEHLRPERGSCRSRAITVRQARRKDDR